MNHTSTIVSDVIVGLVSTALAALLIGLITIIICRKKPVESEENPPTKLCARPYALVDIDVAIDGFNHRRIIGTGRLGTVYVARLPSGEVIAVKRINPRFVLSNAGFGFSLIIKSLSLADHPHVVPIIGYSEAPGERIILMEFMGMGSLDFFLHQNSIGAPILDWQHRLKIATEAARGIEYLHEGMAPSIVHGCIKSSNILLDVKFCARISDYGLSFLAPQETKGLVGYVDREYWVDKGGVCKESDVYGFGVVLLELLSGRRCEEGLLVEWALPLIRDMRVVELLDTRVQAPSVIKPLVRLAKVASACVGNTRKHRPSIVQVVAILNNLEMEI